MSKIVRFARNYPFSAICILLIWVLSLAPYFPETPLDHVAFIDKWTHFVMYGGTCAVIWWEYLRNARRRTDGKSGLGGLSTSRFPLFTFVSLVALGGLMELLQTYATTTRSGEWLDFWADSVGVLLGTAVGLAMSRLWFKAQK
ncbi:MAG: VanZ family protein [Prevotella sp.]|nr:VanZ family protein [Prevotella sp.]